MPTQVVPAHGGGNLADPNAKNQWPIMHFKRIDLFTVNPAGGQHFEEWPEVGRHATRSITITQVGIRRAQAVR